MRITVTVPAPKSPKCLRPIADQLERGHTRGHKETNPHCNDPKEN